MMVSEPESLIWVVHQALGRDREFPSADAWRRDLAALRASRLTALAAHLCGPRLESLPPDLRVHLEAAALWGNSLAERGVGQLAEAAAVFNQLNIGWVVLKGWPLAARLYPSPACRPSGDLDLLVAPEDVAAASNALLQLGYQIEGEDRSYHTRLVRSDPGPVVSVIELHHRVGPPTLGGPGASHVLAGRRPWESPGGAVWIPSPEAEVDILIRHYLRHAGDQAILLLDLAKLIAGTTTHALGSLVGDDLARLGLERKIDGPVRWSHATLRHWMQRRTFDQRRAERHAALVGIPLALSPTPVSALASLARLVWPRHPTPRWVGLSQTGAGRHTWRWRRLLRRGR